MRTIKILLFSIILLSSCKPYQVLVHDVQFRDRIQHDTIVNTLHDSIHIEQRADTVFVDHYRTLIKNRIINKTDSLTRYVDKPIPINIIKTISVKKPLTWIQKILIKAGITFLTLILMGLIYLIFKNYKKVVSYLLFLLKL
jgi:hypothetical protein